MTTEHLVFAADDGELLHGFATGHGSPLLLLHGWTSSHAAWSPLLADLARQHRVIRPDARGHGGRSLAGNPTPDMARLAQDVLNWLDHLGLARASVVGHSMGALTLWEFIRRFGTARLDRLCVLDQSPKLMTDAAWPHGIYGDFDAARAARFVAELEHDFAEAVLRLAAYGLNPKALQSYERNGAGWQRLREVLRGWPAEPLIALWQSLVAADWRDVLPRTDRPTLLVYGQASNFYTEALAHYVAQHTPQSTLLRYEGADHGPHLMQPQRFVQDWLAFWRGAHS
jgi:pimeloyl-ACP methyl ester carboxylesterase